MLENARDPSVANRFSPATMPLITLLLLAQSEPAPPLSAVEEPPPPAEQRIHSPDPRAKSRFGHALTWLDFDANGVQDLAVAAPGENAVYVFFGPKLERSLRIAPEKANEGDSFGFDVAAGEIDDQPGDELVIGANAATVHGVEKAGQVFIVSIGEAHATPLHFGLSQGAGLGTSLAVGDFDGDGFRDIAAGAPKHKVGGEASGAVFLHSPRTQSTTSWNNPLGKWKHGNYGHDLAAADANGDGKLDLFVSAVGNRSNAGIRGAGQVYVHLNPVPENGMIAVEDPNATEGDGARFGMSIDAGDLDGDGRAELLVGSPRKDGGGIEDAGIGVVFHGPSFGSEEARTLLRPGGKTHDVFGFRALVADVIGGPRPDAIFGSLGRENPHALIAWDAGDPEAGAPRTLVAPHGRSSHSFQGLAAAPASEDWRAVLALGDPLFGNRELPNAGRVVVWRFAR